MQDVTGYAAVIASFVCAIMALHLAASPARKRPLQALLAAFFGLFAALLALTAVQIQLPYADIGRAKALLVLLVLPAAFLFGRNLAYPSRRAVTIRDAGHLIPVIIAFSAIAAGRAALLDIIVIFAEGAYGLMTARLLASRRLGLRPQEWRQDRSFRWLLAFLALYFSLLVADIAILIQSLNGRLANDTPAFLISMAALFVVSVLLSLAAIGKNSIFAWLEQNLNPKAASPSGETSDASRNLAQRIMQTLARPDIYSDENLTIARLARRMAEPVRRVSEAINRNMARSYSELVSETRINAAKEQLASPEGCSKKIVDIALSVGFGSKSNFNREFKRITGLTPSEYRDRIAQDEGAAH